MSLVWRVLGWLWVDGGMGGRRDTFSFSLTMERLTMGGIPINHERMVVFFLSPLFLLPFFLCWGDFRTREVGFFMVFRRVQGR